MNHISTHFLRLAIIGMGALVLLFCILIIPPIYQDWGRIFPDFAYLMYFIIAGLAVTAVAFYAALYQGFALLKLIDDNQAFSPSTIQALRRITFCGLIISAIYVIGMPVIYMVAQQDDAPGLVVIGMVFAGAPLVVSVFASVVEKLVRSAIAIKTENELTV